MTAVDTRNVTVELADLDAKVAFLADTLTVRTDQRDRARDWAVRLEQENATAATVIRDLLVGMSAEATQSQHDEALAAGIGWLIRAQEVAS